LWDGISYQDQDRQGFQEGLQEKAGQLLCYCAWVGGAGLPEGCLGALGNGSGFRMGFRIWLEGRDFFFLFLFCFIFHNCYRVWAMDGRAFLPVSFRWICLFHVQQDGQFRSRNPSKRCIQQEKTHSPPSNPQIHNLTPNSFVPRPSIDQLINHSLNQHYTQPDSPPSASQSS
jgi:hypothetical protein